MMLEKKIWGRGGDGVKGSKKKRRCLISLELFTATSTTHHCFHEIEEAVAIFSGMDWANFMLHKKEVLVM